MDPNDEMEEMFSTSSDTAASAASKRIIFRVIRQYKLSVKMADRAPTTWQEDWLVRVNRLAKELGLEVKQSTVSGAGYGLFTLIDRNKGDAIAAYFGDELSLSDVKRIYGSPENAPYVFKVRKTIEKKVVTKYIDAASGWECVARFANHGWNPEDDDCEITPEMPRANAWFRSRRMKTPIIEAINFIPAGSEVFVHYCRNYTVPDQGEK